MVIKNHEFTLINGFQFHSQGVTDQKGRKGRTKFGEEIGEKPSFHVHIHTITKGK